MFVDVVEGVPGLGVRVVAVIIIAGPCVVVGAQVGVGIFYPIIQYAH